MLKRIKDSEAYNVLQKMRSDPQKKAMFSLIVCLLFFTVLIIFTRGVNSTVTLSEKGNETSSLLNNYEYTYVNNYVTVFGMKYNEKQVFSILDKRYYYNGVNVYMINGNEYSLQNDFDLSVLKITPKLIDDLTRNLNYSEANGFRQYLVPLASFINLYDVDTPVDLSLANSYNVIVEKYYENDDLYRIDVDLSSYYNFYNINDDGKLHIYLYNKNKLNKFYIEYDKMLGVKE